MTLYRFTHGVPYISVIDGRWHFAVCVFYGDEYIGGTCFRFTERSLIPSGWTEVDSDHRGLGIATAMYRWAEELTGLQVRPSSHRSDDARRLWRGIRRVKWRRDQFVLPTPRERLRPPAD